MIHSTPNPSIIMKKNQLVVLAALVTLAKAQAALTTGLVGFWDFEGNTANGGNGGAAFNGTLMGNASTNGNARAGSGALSLDGTGDYLDITSTVDVSQGWSISAWFFADVAPAGRAMVFESSGSYAMSFGIREGTTGNTNFQAYADAATGTDPFIDYQVSDTATAGSWHHILLAFTPSTPTTAGSVTGYLDGTQRYSLAIPANIGLAPANGFHLGTYRSADGRWFDGSIDEVAMWNRTLDSTEANEVFTTGQAGLSVPEPSVAMLGGLGFLMLLRRRA